MFLRAAIRRSTAGSDVGDPGAVIPAYLGWNNAERDKVNVRLYATDDGNSPRWDKRFEGGRVVEYAAVERFGPAEGDQFLVVRIGDRFTPVEVIERVTAAVLAALEPS
jgi:hypothetical protein